MLKILYATNDKPRSITQLSEDFDIPITACYRRIEDLRARGLVFEEGTQVSEKGRRIKLYKSSVSKIDVHFQNGKMVFEISTDDGERMARRLDVPDRIGYRMRSSFDDQGQSLFRGPHSQDQGRYLNK